MRSQAVRCGTVVWCGVVWWWCVCGVLGPGRDDVLPARSAEIISSRAENYTAGPLEVALSPLCIGPAVFMSLFFHVARLS